MCEKFLNHHGIYKAYFFSIEFFSSFGFRCADSQRRFMFHNLLALIGIMSAMPQEAKSLLEKIEDQKTIQMGTHQFVTGTFENEPVVFSLSGIGKVSAATTATL